LGNKKKWEFCPHRKQTAQACHGPEVMLWGAVLLKAINDYRMGLLNEHYFDSRDFKFICELTGADEETIREGILGGRYAPVQHGEAFEAARKIKGIKRYA
jgi:hypothetical protein